MAKNPGTRPLDKNLANWRKSDPDQEKDSNFLTKVYALPIFPRFLY
jgi:hypothetical protein